MTSQRDCLLPVSPSDCAVLVSVPITEARFREQRADIERHELARLQESWSSYEDAVRGPGGVLDLAGELAGMTLIWDATLEMFADALARMKVVVLVAHAPARAIEPEDVLDAEVILREARAPSDLYGIELQKTLARTAPDLLRDFTAARSWRERLAHHLGEMSRFDLERMFPRALRPGPAIELADGMFTVEELIAAIPESFSGTLDLTCCSSVLLLEEIRRARPNCLVVSNALQTDLVRRFVYLTYLAAFLESEPRPYLEALELSRKHITSRRGVVLGGPATNASIETPPARRPVMREVRAIAPELAPRDAEFKIHVELALPGAPSNERPAAVVPLSFAALEKSPEVSVLARSDLFTVGPASQRIRIDARPLVRLSFTARLAPELVHASGPGEVWIDVFYADELVAATSWVIALAAETGIEHTVSFEPLMSIDEALEQQQLLDDAGAESKLDRLPEPLAAPFAAMARAASPFENAGWIPLVFEAFLRYHLSVLGEPYTELDSPRQTLGLLRSRFEAWISKRHATLGYLVRYRESAFVRLFNSLLDYRNRVWGHPRFFPSAAQCAELYARYRPKLELILRVVAEANQPAWLVATNADGAIELTTPSGAPAPPAALDPSTVYLVGAGGWTPLGDAVRRSPCPRCERGHFELFAGVDSGTRHYAQVAGSCPKVSLDQLLPP